MKNLLPLFLLIFLTNSCGPIIKLAYGVTNPKIESEASLTKYMKNKKIPAENVYTIGFDEYEATLAQANGSVPEVLIFDKAGNLIPYTANSDQCTAGAFRFIEELKAEELTAKSDSSIFVDGTLTGLHDIGISNVAETQLNPNKQASLEEAKKHLRNLKGNLVEVELEDNYDYYIFIYWAKFTGKLNKDHVLVWEKQALENKNAKIKVMKVNMDIQSYWGDENLKQVKGLKIKK